MKRIIYGFILSLLSFAAHSADSHSYSWYADQSSAQSACNAKYQSMTNPATAHYACSYSIVNGGAVCSGGNMHKYTTREGFYNPTSNEYFHFQACIASNYCVAPTVIQLDGSCDAPCPTAGTKQDIAIRVGNKEGAQGLNSLNIFDPQTAIYQGAEYSYYPEDYVSGSSYVRDDGSIMSKYAATATGQCTNDADTAETSETGKPAVATSNQGQCVADAKGNTVCKDSPSGNLQCGTVNGDRVCFDTTPGVGTVNGQPYTTADKNCGMLNGDPVCVTDNSESPTTEGCVVNGSVKNCVNSDVKVTKETQTTNNPDGSKTVVETEHNNIIGSGDKVTTKTIDQNGNVTHEQTVYQGGTGSSGASGAESGGDGTENLNGPKTSGSGVFPEVGGFYTSAYPEGLAGIWDANKAGLNSTPFMQSLGNLNPFSGASNSGSCPVWTIVLWQLGTFNFDGFCWVFPFIRVVLLITTLFTIRSIVFGG
jgi:hypothetical protein